MPTENQTDEISFGDLGEVFRKIYHFFLIRLYRFIQFLIKSWIILIVLILLGVILGYWKTTDVHYSKKSESIVRINYKGANYIYDAVDLLSEKLKEGDTAFFRKNNLLGDESFSIRGVKIEPIVDLNAVLDNYPSYNRTFEILLQENQFKDKVLTSEMFLQDYKLHRLTVNTTSSGNSKSVKAVIDYLNRYPGFQTAKSIYKDHLAFQIRETAYSISRIDSIFNKAGKITFQKGSAGSQVHIHNEDMNIDRLNELLQEKSRLMRQLRDLKLDQQNDNQMVTQRGIGALIPQKSFFANKMIWYPIIFILLFIWFAACVHIFKKAKHLSKTS